jgi:excisionase family DNA binding protein
MPQDAIPGRTLRALRTHNVARRLKVSSRTVRWWAEKGLLPAKRYGVRPWAFDEADVIEFARVRGLQTEEA